MDDTDLTCPYVEGGDVLLTLPDAQTITVKIIEVHTRTMSCVMTIRLPQTLKLRILKLYDRRYSDQIRQEYGAAPWNSQLEWRYREFVSTGRPSSLFEVWSAGFREDQYYEDEQREHWDDVTLETYLRFLCEQEYDTESHAYQLLHDLQGECVPTVYSFVTLIPTETQDGNGHESHRHDTCPGIMMQHIEGFPLTDIATEMQRERWQEICDKAISIIHRIGDHGVCNRDVKTRSFIIRRDSGGEFRDMFMMDFGLCVFRDRLKSDREFQAEQAYEDEEGAVGCVMERQLQGGYNYQMSDRALSLSKEFMSEDCD